MNRKYVSYILFEYIQEKPVITILLTHGPNYHAWKSDLYPLHLPCETAKKCYEEAQYLDSLLVSGNNIGLVLQGNWIVKIITILLPSEE